MSLEYLNEFLIYAQNLIAQFELILFIPPLSTYRSQRNWEICQGILVMYAVCYIKQTWLYLASRSPRQGAPAFICPVARPTDRSAMNESSVSPLIWDITTPQWASFAILTTSMASVTVPIWFTWRLEAIIPRIWQYSKTNTHKIHAGISQMFDITRICCKKHTKFE